MKYQILGSWVNDKGKASRAPRRRPEIYPHLTAAQLKIGDLTDMYGQCCKYDAVEAEE